MEKFILRAGKALAKLRSRIDYFLEEKVQENSTNLILLILSVFIFFVLGFSLIFNFQSFVGNYLIFFIVLIVMVLILIWMAIFYESNKHLETDRHNFQIIPLKSSKIKFALINLDNPSKEEFKRFLKGKYVHNKINFTMGNKSGDSANHRLLFVMFDELLVGGIQNLSGKRKQEFFGLLMNTFLMNKEPLKENTLKTSFSAWKSEQEKINSRNQRKLIKQMLGKE